MSSVSESVAPEVAVEPAVPVHRDLRTMLADRASVHPAVVALEEDGRPDLTYGDLDRIVGGLVSDLRHGGVKPEDRVAVVIPNGRDMSVALLAVCSSGVAAPLNPIYREDEFADYFREIRVSYLVIRRGMASPARAAAAKMGIKILELTAEADAIVPEGEKGGRERGEKTWDPPAPNDLAVILLTSGSTGRSKKVPLTHRNVCVSVRDICRTLELTARDRCLCMWEQFHIGGLVDLLIVPLASGGTVICTNGFDATRFYDLVERKQPTWYQGVPATVHELMAHARRLGIAGVKGRLRFVRVTASALAPKLMDELETFFGVPVITTFGMTEAAPLITTNLLPPHVRKPGSTGPSCGPEIIITDEDGQRLATGEVGEVLIRGDNIILGYEDAPEANARSFRDGWFRTGDTGCLDEDGYLFLKGRIKESINRGGEKITPQEIDDVLLTHKEIAEAISFHVPHSVLGEDVAVAIVLHRPGSLTEDDVREYVAARMAEFKVPRKVVFVDGFARNASGKVNRSTLAETLGLQASSRYEEPATSLEKTLAAIWERELGVARVGATDNFADLGGSSLSGVRLILEIEKAVGKPLPVRALYRLSTVREMAAAIEAGDAGATEFQPRFPEVEGHKLSFDDYRGMLAVMGSGAIPTWKPGSIVKVIHADGPRPAIFWAFNGPDHEMESLAREMGSDQPIYGMYSGSTTVDREKLPAIAEHYLKEIQAIQPDGPLIIAGNCRGGRLAIRIATRLREVGREVSHLCILEMFERPLYDFDGKLLFLFGKQSHEFRYRDFSYGRPGWKRPFRRVPRVEWVEGKHAAFFARENAGSLAARLKAFLRGEPEDQSIAARLRTQALLLIHRFPAAFRLYVRSTSRT